jgi:hypothetical protein
MSDDTDAARRPRPTRRDWLLVALNAVFVAGGLLMLPSKPDVAIVTLAFFGSCLAIAVANVWRKLRDRKFTAETIDVAGGVPIRPKRGLFLGLGAWLLILGIVLIVFGHAYPLLFRWLAGFIAVVGATLFVGTLVGYWPAGYLQFDPEGLTIADRGWRVVLPWNEITSVVEGDYQSNPVLLICVADASRLAVEPPQSHAQAMKKIARMQTYMGADFAIMTTHYGIDLPTLASAVLRYATDAAARAGLRPRLPRT